jgi:hypothetical protein
MIGRGACPGTSYGVPGQVKNALRHRTHDVRAWSSRSIAITSALEHLLSNNCEADETYFRNLYGHVWIRGHQQSHLPRLSFCKLACNVVAFARTVCRASLTLYGEYFVH